MTATATASKNSTSFLAMRSFGDRVQTTKTNCANKCRASSSGRKEEAEEDEMMKKLLIYKITKKFHVPWRTWSACNFMKKREKNRRKPASTKIQRIFRRFCLIFCYLYERGRSNVCVRARVCMCVLISFESYTYNDKHIAEVRKIQVKIHASSRLTWCFSVSASFSSTSRWRRKVLVLQVTI